MNTYVILRRGGWRTPEELQPLRRGRAGRRRQMSADIRWIRSYVVHEVDRSLGTVCIYQATTPDVHPRAR